MKRSSAETKSINSYLDALKAKVYDYQIQLIREDELVNFENIWNKILGIDKQCLLLISIFRRHNNEIKALEGNHPQVVNQDKFLPILSNQKMNSYLKEIADV